MGFKLSILCLVLLAVAVSASTICKCGPEEKILQDSATGDSVIKYKLKVKNEDGKEHEEEVEIDTEKETERFHVPKTSPDTEEADVVFDFKKNFMMVRLPVDKSCYLSKSTENVPKPADLVRLLDSSKDGAVTMARNRPEVNFKVAGIVNDRSILNDEMADLCAKLPIYLFVKVDKATTDLDQPMEPMDQTPAKRTKRGCTTECTTTTTRRCWTVLIFFRNCKTESTETCVKKCD